MSNKPFNVKRLPQQLYPDANRVILRLFLPGDESRIHSIISRIRNLTETDVICLLAQVQESFGAKHDQLNELLADNYKAVKQFVPENNHISHERQLLIGAYFSMDYAIESAALFNPSMVPALNQDKLPSGSTRFLMSLRATGEGHVSSIVFRRGVINDNNEITIEPISPYTRPLKVVENRSFDKTCFRIKLIEMGAFTELSDEVLDNLPVHFTLHQLNQAIDSIRTSMKSPVDMQETVENMLTLAKSNYELKIPSDVDPSEIVIFPVSEHESRGIEDVRLVQFTQDDRSICYYGTYTAFNGLHSIPQLLEISDINTVKVQTINGFYAQNKGMALFPRKVNGVYMMISRLDNENLYLMTSDNILFWNDAKLLQQPKFPWEFIQIGNCGSPIETNAGWLLLTHGVGPMRQYCIGVTLLDRDEPSKIISQLKDPILVPTGKERTGYVPNVVYSCGGMVHHDTLIIPYAMSDFATGFASIPLNELLEHLSVTATSH